MLRSIAVFVTVLLGSLMHAGVASGQEEFTRGDCNADGYVELSDAAMILDYLFAGGSTPSCLDACDVNDSDLQIQIDDAVFLLSYLFASGAEPPAPFPDLGLDATSGGPGCEVATSAPPPAGFATSITQYGVTWQFDGSYQVGQFVTGDYWVIGPVTIVSVTPSPSGGNHGSMVNPSTSINSAYDSQVPYYDGSLGETYPLELNPGDSLVSTVSHTVSGPYEDLIELWVSQNHAKVKSAAVLTCLASPASTTAFRPPYAGSEKPIFDSATLDWSLLPDLTPTSGGLFVPLNGQTPCQRYAEVFARPWIHHIYNWVGRLAHPTDNMPNYHWDIYHVISDAALLLLCDYPDREELMIGFVQLGIDQHYVQKDDAGDRGIHKWTILFAGLMLGETEMQDPYGYYRTDYQTYYAGSGGSPYSSSIVPSGEGWTGDTVLFRRTESLYEHEHLHPTEWGVVPSGGGMVSEQYRRSNSFAWPGAALAAHAMGAVDLWDNSSFFDYVDRWMTEPEEIDYLEGLWALPLWIESGEAGSNFVENMWDEYRSTF